MIAHENSVQEGEDEEEGKRRYETAKVQIHFSGDDVRDLSLRLQWAPQGFPTTNSQTDGCLEHLCVRHKEKGRHDTQQKTS